MKRGFTLAEVVVGAAIILLFISALAASLSFYVRVLPARTQHIQAAFLAQEGVEIVKHLRNSSWDTNIATLVVGDSYYLNWTGSAWETTTTANTVNEFTRTVVVNEAYRDGNDDIADSGTEDPGTRELVVAVSWNSGAETESITTYITDLFDN